jgi:hypothetical protein
MLDRFGAAGWRRLVALAVTAGFVGSTLSAAPVAAATSDTAVSQPAPSTGVGRGIAQWSVNGRWRGVLKLASHEGKAAWDFSVQLDFLWQELSTTYARTRSYLNSATNLGQAVAVWQNTYEIPIGATPSNPYRPDTIAAYATRYQYVLYVYQGNFAG